MFQSARSPFARRIRLLLEELGVKYDLVVEDVFRPTPGFLQINPVGRVPALRIQTGELITDSSQIQNWLAGRFFDHSLFRYGTTSEAHARGVSGLAVGLMEWTITNYLESTRAPGQRDLSTSCEALDRINAVLRKLEAQLKGPYFYGEHMGFWDLDLGAALAYSDLRNGCEIVDRFPRLRGYLSMLETRASFQKTQPPK